MMHFVSEEKFNLSANYCSHIEEHTNDPVYAEIEKEVALNSMGKIFAELLTKKMHNEFMFNNQNLINL